MGSLCLILITRQPAPPVRMAAHTRGFGEHQARPGILCPPHAACLLPCGDAHVGIISAKSPPRPRPRGCGPARCCLAGLCPSALQLGCAHTDSYIKPGILRQ